MNSKCTILSPQTADLRTLPPELGFLNPVAIADLTRYGVECDGGYVLPSRRIDDIDGIVSFGLCYDWSFEQDIAARRPGIPIHVYDHTAGEPLLRRSVLAGVAKLLLGRVSFAELAVRLRNYRAYGTFFCDPRHHFRERVFNRMELPFDATIDRVFERMAGRRHLLLKMDIEGGEYRVLPQILKYADRIELMAIEFHDTDPYRDVFIKQTQAILSLFDIVHVHGNNYSGTAADGLPDGIEISFMKRSNAPVLGRRNRLPLEGLDFPCDPTRPDLRLVFC
jgi:hypothetical protein